MSFLNEIFRNNEIVVLEKTQLMRMQYDQMALKKNFFKVEGHPKNIGR